MKSEHYNYTLDTGRDALIDVVKGIGILLVVMSHTFGAGAFAARLYFMPLFLWVSGMLYRRERLAVFIYKRLKRLYVPFIIWELLFLFLNPFFVSIGIISSKEGERYSCFENLIHILLFDNTSILLAPLWFLPALFVGEIILWFTDFMIENMRIGIIGGRVVRILFAMIFIYSGIYIGYKNIFFISWSYNFGACVGVCFESAGYCLMGFALKEYMDKMSNWVSLLAFAGLIIFERVALPVADMRTNDYTFPLLTPIFAVVGIMGIFSISRIVVNKDRLMKMKEVLLTLGSSSLIVMCLHPLAIKLVSLFQVYFLGYPMERLSDWQLVSSDVIWKTVYFVIGFSVPLLLVCLFDKTKGLKMRL